MGKTFKKNDSHYPKDGKSKKFNKKSAKPQQRPHPDELIPNWDRPLSNI
jgi:hypothetical protein